MEAHLGDRENIDAKSVAGSDIPQSDRLLRIREVVSAIGGGLSNTASISAKISMAPRQVAYAKQAARVLGWIKPDGLNFAITEAGAFLLAQPPRSAGEVDVVRSAIESSPVLQRFVPSILAPEEPDRSRLRDQIIRLTGMSRDTATRRAGTLLSWRQQLLPERNLRLPVPDSEVVAPKSHPRLPTIAPKAVTAVSVPPTPLPLWPAASLSDDLIQDILRDNPWWQGQPGKLLPPHRRGFVDAIQRKMNGRLAPITVVRGPRQVGKTTAQLQVIDDLLKQGVPPTRILRVQCDEVPALKGLSEPILRIVDWFEAAVLRKTLNAAAAANEPTYLFFDEVQNLADWAIQLKHLVDASSTRVVVTGSSALRIEAGRDSLAGRISSMEVGTLTLREIAEIRGLGKLVPSLDTNGLERLIHKDFWVGVRENGKAQAAIRDQAFRAFSERGGYPLVHEKSLATWEDIAEQLNETVIRRVIKHDLRVGDRGRKRDEALLEELFRLSCRYAGQSPGPDLFARETQRALRSNVGVNKIRNYLDFLDRTLLLRLVRPLELRLKKTQGAPKLCLADHGLRASWLQEVVPLDPEGLARNPHLADLAGRIAESVVGTYLLTIGGLNLAHFPPRQGEPEVDFVMTIGAQRIPVEIKYRSRIDPRADTEGLRSFIERSAYNAPFGLLITQSEASLDDPRIVALPLSSLLMLR